jgi:hypothetical protein
MENVEKIKAVQNKSILNENCRSEFLCSCIFIIKFLIEKISSFLEAIFSIASVLLRKEASRIDLALNLVFIISVRAFRINTSGMCRL